MKVKDAIAALQKCDPEATMIVTSSNFELNGAMVAAGSVHQYDKGSARVQSFHDAFDGGSYDKEVWNIIGGDKKVVTIS